jgi:hypothetical protein
MDKDLEVRGIDTKNAKISGAATVSLNLMRQRAARKVWAQDHMYTYSYFVTLFESIVLIYLTKHVYSYLISKLCSVYETIIRSRRQPHIVGGRLDIQP